MQRFPVRSLSLIRRFCAKALGSFARINGCRSIFAIQMVTVALALLSLGAPRMWAQYSVTKFIDPNTFPTDTTPGFSFGGPIATDGTYTAISTSDAVWSKTVAGGTPIKLFSIGTNLPSSGVPASYIYGAVEVSEGIVVFYAIGESSGGNLYGIYSVKADGSAGAVRVADSTQVAAGVWYEDVNIYGEYGLFAVAKGKVVFSIGGALFSANVDGTDLTTLWATSTSFTGCPTAGEYSTIFPVTAAFGAVTDGTNYAYTGATYLSFVALYTEPLGTQDGCNDLITSGTCNICGPVSTLPGQPQPGIAFVFQDLLQIDGDYIYFQADAGGGGLNGEDYYGIFKVPLAGGAVTPVVTNLSQLPLLKNSSGTYDEPGFGGYAVNNGKFIVYAGDNTQGGTGQPAFYMLDGNNWVTLFTNQTSVDNECTGNMTYSSLAGLVQPELTADGHLYFSAEALTTGPTTGPDLNGSCTYSFLRFLPFSYYVLDTTHPLIPSQTTITMTPTPASITTGTPVTLSVAVAGAPGAANPGSLVPSGVVNAYFTSPQVFGVQSPGQATIDANGNATFTLGDLAAIKYNFTVSYGGDSNFTSNVSNAIALNLIPPTASLSATSLAFGNQEVGTTSASQSVTLTNPGGTALTIASIAVTGADTSSFIFANNCGTSLASGASCTIHGHFTPAVAGALTAAITITDAAGGSPQSIALAGTGGTVPQVSLSATSLSFGTEPVGVSSASQSVTLTNSGSLNLSITNIALTGTDASSFLFGNNCGTSVAPGASCSIHGHFAPALAGAQTAAITITDNASGSPQMIALTGMGGTPPAVSLSAASLSFGAEELGTTSASQTVTLTNSGQNPLSITSIAVTGADASSFLFSSSCGVSVAAGANCTIHGHFTPAAAGALSAAVTITDNASGSPQSIALTGTGGTPPAVSLSGSSLTFATQNIGTTSASQSVTLTNTGGTKLVLTSVAVTGTDASSFIFANSCGTSVAAGASCTIHGHFTPTAAGPLTAAVTITDNASGSPQSIALTGMGH